MSERQTGADQAAAPEKKIDRETAENEFIRYCDSNGIEHNEDELNEEELELFKDIKKRFIKACTEGRVEVDGRNLKYTLSEFSPEGFKGEVVTIKRPGGNAFSAGDSFKEKESIKRLQGFLSAQTGKDVSYFTKIDVLDWKFFNAIASLFLSL
jgi:hypothetical protein